MINEEEMNFKPVVGQSDHHHHHPPPVHPSQSETEELLLSSRFEPGEDCSGSGSVGSSSSNMTEAELRSLALKLYEVDAVNFGDFTLRGGMYTPIYFDLRLTVSYPPFLEELADRLYKVCTKNGAVFDLVCGVPYAALPLATCISIRNRIPMVMCRKEVKVYGTKKLVEGHYESNQCCLVIDDVIVSGRSILETTQVLRNVGLRVKDAAFILDREQGGKEILANAGLVAHSVISMTEIVTVLHGEQKINGITVQKVEKFLQENNCYKSKPLEREESSSIEGV